MNPLNRGDGAGVGGGFIQNENEYEVVHNLSKFWSAVKKYDALCVVFGISASWGYRNVRTFALFIHHGKCS